MKGTERVKRTHLTESRNEWGPLDEEM